MAPTEASRKSEAKISREAATYMPVRSSLTVQERKSTSMRWIAKCMPLMSRKGSPAASMPRTSAPEKRRRTRMRKRRAQAAPSANFSSETSEVTATSATSPSPISTTAMFPARKASMQTNSMTAKG